MGERKVEGEREHALRNLAFLAEVTPALVETLDVRQVLERVAQALVPILADWCAVDVLDESGSIERIAVVHADPEKRALAEALKSYPPDPDGERQLLSVLRDGSTRIFPDVTEDQLRAASRSEAHLELMKQLAPSAAMIVPLVSRGTVLGTLTLVSASPGHRYDPADVELAEDVARRAALALDNATLHGSVSNAERRYRELVESLDGVVWEADATTGTFTFVSGRSENLLGYPPEKWLEDPDFWRSIILPADKDAAVAAWDRASREGSEMLMEYRAFASDGRTVWLQDRIRVIADESSRPRKLHGLIVDVTDAKLAERRQEAQHAVVKVMAEARSLPAAARDILRSLCDALDWDAGLLWMLDEQLERLRCIEVYRAGSMDIDRFEHLSRTILFEPGVGLPGRVWATRSPAWIENVTADGNFPRAAVAAEEGLFGAFGFPLVGGKDFLGVIEFFSREVREPDDDLLRTMATVGTQIGQFIVRKRLEEESDFRKLLLESQMDATIDGVLVVAPDLSIIYSNSRLLEMWGISEEDVSNRSRMLGKLQSLVADLAAFTRGVNEAWEQPLRTRRDEIGLLDGRVFDRYGSALLGQDGTFYGRAWFFRDITQQKRVEAILREANERTEFLAEAGVLLARSLHLPTTLRSLAEFIVPRLADWCGVDMVDEDGSLQRLATAHAEATTGALIQELTERYPPAPDAPRGPVAVVRTGRAELYETISEDLMRESARSREHLEMMQALGAISAMVVPLNARGRTLGALTLVSSSRRYSAADLAFAEDLAWRAALAVDNARVYGERSRVARTLQESLLPPLLPAVPGADLAARYRPAGHGTEVGGDFYDVFATGREDWTIVMGDVCGKGAEAAAVTALARYTLRAAAMQAKKPTRVLATLNEAMLRQRNDGRFCTAVYARLRNVEGGLRVTLACGGHPQPFVVRRTGEVEAAGSLGTLLGLFPEPEISDSTLHLHPGDLLVLYTDGVIEARSDDRVFGEEGLISVLSACRGLDASDVAERIDRAVASFQEGMPRDDVAVLVVRAT